MSNELNRRVGVNFPQLAYDRVLGLPVTPYGGYRQGVHLWVPGQDTKAFLEARRRGEMTFRAWVGSLLHRQYLTLLDFQDPGPFIAKLRRRLSGAATKRSA
jgi:hypothetical protein